MRGETLLGEALPFGAGTAVVGVRVYGNAAARGEETGDLDVFRVHQANQVLHDFVHAVFVEIAVVPETEKIEFQAFALDHPAVRDIADAYLGEIGLSGNRAKAGELRAIETHPIVIVGMFVLKSFQHFRSIIHLVFGLISEGLESLKFSSF